MSAESPIPFDYPVPASLRHRAKGMERSGRRHPRFPQLSLTRLSKQTGIDLTTLSRILSGERRPQLANAIKLSKALKVSVEEVEKWYVSKSSDSR